MVHGKYLNIFGAVMNIEKKTVHIFQSPFLKIKELKTKLKSRNTFLNTMFFREEISNLYHRKLCLSHIFKHDTDKG